MKKKLETSVTIHWLSWGRIISPSNTELGSHNPLDIGVASGQGAVSERPQKTWFLKGFTLRGQTGNTHPGG